MGNIVIHEWVLFRFSGILVQVRIRSGTAGCWHTHTDRHLDTCMDSPALSHAGRVGLSPGLAPPLTWRCFCSPASSFSLSAHLSVSGMKFHFRISWSAVVNRTPAHVINTSELQRCGKQKLKKGKSSEAGTHSLSLTETITPSDVFVPPQLGNSCSIQRSI